MALIFEGKKTNHVNSFDMFHVEPSRNANMTNMSLHAQGNVRLSRGMKGRWNTKVFSGPTLLFLNRKSPKIATNFKSQNSFTNWSLSKETTLFHKCPSTCNTVFFLAGKPPLPAQIGRVEKMKIRLPAHFYATSPLFFRYMRNKKLGN